jgi:phenylalanine-4-hydroxylase
MAYKIGGIESINKGIESKTVCTFELDTGLQISGVPTEVFGIQEEFYKFTGPVQLSYKNNELDGHGGGYHRDGFSSPLCSDLIINQLQEAPINEKINIIFDSGINLEGIIKSKISDCSKLLVVSFNDCKITKGDKILFNPDWGPFDLACGNSVVSVYGGPADIKSYLGFMNIELPNKVKPKYLTKYSESEKLLINLYEKVKSSKSKLGDNNEELRLIIDKLDTSFQDDWLLRFELLNILNPEKDLDLISKLKSQINNISKENYDLQNSIKRGLNRIFS